MSVFFLPTALGQHDSDLQSCHFGTEFIPTLQAAFQKKVAAVVALMASTKIPTSSWSLGNPFLESYILKLGETPILMV